MPVQKKFDRIKLHSRARPGGGAPGRGLRLVARRHRLPRPLVVLGGPHDAAVLLDLMEVGATQQVDVAVVLVRGWTALEDVGVDRDAVAGGVRVCLGIVGVGAVVQRGRRAGERERRRYTFLSWCERTLKVWVASDHKRSDVQFDEKVPAFERKLTRSARPPWDPRSAPRSRCTSTPPPTPRRRAPPRPPALRPSRRSPGRRPRAGRRCSSTRTGAGGTRRRSRGP